MSKRFVLALSLASFAVSPAAAVPPDPNPDPYSPDRKQVELEHDKARKFLDDFARCVASRQPRKAAAVLALPYGSDQQLKAASDLATGEYDCLGPYTGRLEMTFDAPSLAAGMAEYFIANPKRADDVRRREPNSFVHTEPAGLEIFGHCVVEQNPSAVGILAKSAVASEAETAATDALMPELQQCVSRNQTLALDRTALRQLLVVSLYKHVAMPAPELQAETGTHR